MLKNYGQKELFFQSKPCSTTLPEKPSVSIVSLQAFLLDCSLKANIWLMIS